MFDPEGKVAAVLDKDRTQAQVEGLLSVNDLARYLSCSRTYAAKLVANNTIPSLRLGGLRRVRKSDVDEIVERQLEASKNEDSA